MSEPATDLGKALRVARGTMTQRVAAQAAGLSFTTISKFEHGADLPGPASLRRLATVYGVPAEPLEALRRAAKPCCAAARAEALAELRRGVEGLRIVEPRTTPGFRYNQALAAVLALFPKAPK